MEIFLYCDARDFSRIKNGKIERLKIYVDKGIAHIESVEKDYKPKIIKITLKEKDGNGLANKTI